jgi:hypothetical protein
MKLHDGGTEPVKSMGRGWSNLWSLPAQDRWAWFVCKIFGFFKKKNPLVRVRSFRVPEGALARVFNLKTHRSLMAVNYGYPVEQLTLGPGIQAHRSVATASESSKLELPDASCGGPDAGSEHSIRQER